MVSRLKIEFDKLGVEWQPNKNYTFRSTAGLVRESEGNRSDSPAQTFGNRTTNASGPEVLLDVPTGTNVTNNTHMELIFNKLIRAGDGNLYLYERVGGVDTLLRTYNPSDSTPNNEILSVTQFDVVSDKKVSCKVVSELVCKVTRVTSAAPDEVVIETAMPVKSTIDCQYEIVRYQQGKLRLDTLGLIRSNTNYYLLFEAGAVSDFDGFDAPGWPTDDTEFNFTTAPSTDTNFPDLSADITSAFSPTMTVRAIRQGEVVLSTQATLTAQPKITYRITATINSTITQSRPNILRTRPFVSLMSSQVTMTSSVNFIAASASAMSSQFTITKLYWGHPWAAIETIDSTEFDSDVSSGTYSNGSYTYARFSDSRSNKFRPSNLNWSTEPEAEIAFSDDTFVVNGSANTYKVNNNSVSFLTNQTYSVGGYSGRHDLTDVPYFGPSAYNGSYAMVGVQNDQSYEYTRYQNDLQAGTQSGFYNYPNNTFWAHMLNMSGQIINTMKSPETLSVSSFTSGSQTWQLVGGGTSNGYGQDIDFIIDSNVPYGGLAVIATGGKVAVYSGITSSSPTLRATLTASNFVTVTSSETQNYQSGVFINKDYIVLENLGRTVGFQNENSQNGANTYAIDFFDLNNNFARTTYMPGYKIPILGNAVNNQYIELMGISEDSKKYITIGPDVTELPTGGGITSHRVKYRDERP
jgi:hypothetical protein